jgi:hypothetical protein
VSEERQEQIEKMELKLEAYEKCIETIKDLLPEKVEDIEDLEGWFEEVKWLVRCLEDEIC